MVEVERKIKEGDKKPEKLYKNVHGEGKTKITKYNLESKKKEYLTALCESDAALQEVVAAKEYLFQTYIRFGNML